MPVTRGASTRANTHGGAAANVGVSERMDISDLSGLKDSDDEDSDGSPSHGRGRAAPRGGGGRSGRVGLTRAAKHRRAQAQALDSDDEKSEEEQVKAKKRQKPNKPAAAAAAAVPETYASDVHRRKTSLRARLIDGNYAPQPIGMRAYKLRQEQGNFPTTPPHSSPLLTISTAASGVGGPSAAPVTNTMA